VTDFTNLAENGIIDWFLRGQAAPTLPASWHIALFTGAPGEAGGGTEVSAGGYSRQPVARSLAAWSGTQAAGSTTASTGTGGRSSNNALISFGPASADWGTVTHVAWMDAATGGAAWIVRALTTPRAVLSGDRLEFNPDTLALTLA
jgi:hypothetical protein